ncbi:MAG: hypothetical protein K2Y30_08310 [Flavobacteriaceae bacterium]|nr:hypothetical protein [Flavobacteriaceae bacterium]
MKEFKLDNSPKIQSGFKAPDDYFETFAQNLMQKLPQEETKVVSISQRRNIVTLLVAAVVAIALIIPIINTPAPLSKEIDGVTLENYLSYQSNINQFDLIDALDEDDINSIKTNVALDDNSLGNNTIEDILVTNGNLEQLLLE